MSRSGKISFLRSNPELADPKTVKANCDSGETETIEHGCYLFSDKKIYILDFDRKELRSQEVVTAAHEMLHAVYANLDETKRSEINALIEKASKHILAGDAALASRMSVYQEIEPGLRLVELHAILGTEYNNIPVELLDHYELYFVDRGLVLSANAETKAIFGRMESELVGLKGQIDSASTSAKNTYSNHVYRARIGDGRGADYYWNEFEKYRHQYRSLVSQYNAKLDDYNDLARSSNGETKPSLQAEH